jgi:transposase
MEQQVVGLDVSKAFLDAQIGGTRRRLRVTNDVAGIEQLVRELGGESWLVVMEASGGYERPPHRELTRRGFPVAIVNPKRVRDFARSMGKEAKTDRVDSGVIGDYAKVARPAPAPLPHPARTALAELLACRRQVVDEITARRQQAPHLTTDAARRHVQKAMEFLEEQRRLLDRELRAAIRADPALEADHALITSMPGCGPILAATLLACLPELGHLQRRPIAALTGVAPIARDSGTRHGHRAVKGGRPQVRSALYMGAVATLKAKPNPFRDRYERMTARGKPPKVAIVALMRHMLVTLNAMLNSRQRWKCPD